MELKQIGIVGAGNMGSMMGFAFSELGLDQVDQADGLIGNITGFHGLSKFTASLGRHGDRKVFPFSITHGTPADEVLQKIKPELRKGDILLGGNENYRNTERRQREYQDIGVDWIEMGVSGGYQSDRHGPNMSPGESDAAMEAIMPLLEQYAAKDPKPGDSNHFVKMVHNGIETIKATNGEPTEHQGGYVLDEILDKVVQDDDSTEGIPSWSIMESAMRHVSCPTLAAGFYFRVASGNREERLKVAQKHSVSEPKSFQDAKERVQIIENLRRATYCAFLASYCQGLELIARTVRSNWRAGCIIQSEFIADLLESPLKENNTLTNVELVDCDVASPGIETDHYLPALSATLEYVKYTTGKMLPTKCMEAQMDYFGAHSYHKPGVPDEDPGPVAKGPHHFEWKPA
ncbi:6-phosphogluconate dehydrogenase [Trichoderma chlorosporum]